MVIIVLFMVYIVELYIPIGLTTGKLCFKLTTFEFNKWDPIYVI